MEELKRIALQLAESLMGEQINEAYSTMWGKAQDDWIEMCKEDHAAKVREIEEAYQNALAEHRDDLDRVGFQRGESTE